MPAPPLTDHFATLAPHYDAVLSDVWGVIHNGVTAFPAACDALARFRQNGGSVVLISNAPRPGAQVIRLLDHLHVPRETYDGITTSGDVTRTMVEQRSGQRVFLIGPERDHTIFTGLDAPFSGAAEAEYVVCTGLFDDEVETPEDYAPLLGELRERNLFMVCANPDIVVERGHRLVYCAGALADAYAALGGEVYYAGKPHRPLYDLALRETARARAARSLGSDVTKSRVLAIGDSVRTDLKGAQDLGVDCLFVTAGIHAEELGHRDDPDLSALGEMFAAAGHAPKAVTRKLIW
ncbi:MAG TPA: TIGR01459 family HAD-type hydrolase [Xanthobacteraceae bacterium]|nr:TIGR01459 family HAD-type hydrolase [Xanthobacteraceae bacterium]